MAYKMIQVGTGGRGRAWCERILPPNIDDGLIEIVAAVDANRDVLANAQTLLGLPAEKCYTDLKRAFDENDADFVLVPEGMDESALDGQVESLSFVASETFEVERIGFSVRVIVCQFRARHEHGAFDFQKRRGHDQKLAGRIDVDAIQLF